MNKQLGLLILTSIMLTISFRVADLDGWDESFYLAQVHSVVQDKDLLLQNDLLKFPNPFLEKYRAVTILDSNGAILNCFSAGPGLFYSPVLVLLSKAGVPLNDPLVKNSLAVFALIVLALAIPALVRLVTETIETRQHAVAAALVAVISTPFLIYGCRYYLASHFPGTVMVILAYMCGLRWISRSRHRQALLTGLFCGMVILIRWQDVILLIPLMAAGAGAWIAGNRNWSRRIPFFLPGFLLPCLIQMIAWKIQFNQWLIIPQGSGFMQWHKPDFMPFLFSGFHGVLPWTPGLLLGLLGLFIPFKSTRKPHIRGFILGMIITWPLVFYVSAAAQDWWAGSSYGCRRLTSLLPMVAVGYAGWASVVKPWIRNSMAVFLCLWALLTGSAFLAHIDDLSLVVTRQTSRANPVQKQLTDTEYDQMVSYWGKRLERMVKPRFALSRAATHPARIIGFLICLCGVTMSWLFWRFPSVSLWCQRWFLAGFLLWLTISVVFLAGAVSPYRTWNSVWYQVVRGREIAIPNDDSPSEFWEAAAMVRAVRAVRSYQPEEASRIMKVLETFPYVTSEEIESFGKNPDNKPLIDRPYLVER